MEIENAFLERYRRSLGRASDEDTAVWAEVLSYVVDDPHTALDIFETVLKDARDDHEISAVAINILEPLIEYHPVLLAERILAAANGDARWLTALRALYFFEDDSELARQLQILLTR